MARRQNVERQTYRMGGLDVKWYEIVVCILGAIGGLDFIKFLTKSIFNRKNNARMADSEADASEFHILREEIVFFQQQIKDKTSLVRKQNAEILELTNNIATAEIEHAKEIAALEIQMMQVKCVDKNCPFRLPPNAYTPPKDGLTKEEYAEARETELLEIDNTSNNGN